MQGMPVNNMQVGQTYLDANGISTRQVFDDRGWKYDTESPLDKIIKNTLQKTWFRLEYLQWEVDEPGDQLLGAPVLGVSDPREPFDVFANGILVGQARVASTDDMSFDDINGIRGTFGIPLVGSTMETSFWGLAQDSSVVGAPELPSPTPPDLGEFVGTSTTVNGVVGDNLFLYDESYDAYYSTQSWGAEVNFVTDPARYGEGLVLMPILGLRYFSLEERLNQTGVFNSFGTIPDITSGIRSTTNNHLYGPQVGMRMQLVHRWFSISVEPKVMLGMNSYSAQVKTISLRSAADPTVFTKETGSEFTAIADLGINAKVRVNEFLSLFVGYNVMWAGRVSRPHGNIRYNDNGAFPNLADVVLDTNSTDMVIQGISIGGEFKLP